MIVLNSVRLFIQRFLLIIIALIVLVVSIVFNSSIINGQKKDLANQSSEIVRLENQIDVLTRSAHNIEQQSLRKAVGIDDERLSRDETVIDDFLKSVMSWSSFDEYMGVRDMLKSKYGLDDKSDVLTVFMPEIPNEVSNDGKTNYNRIDTYGLHISYDKCDIYNTNIVATDYVYTIFAKWHTSDDKGSVGNASTIFTMMIDYDGNISDIHAFA